VNRPQRPHLWLAAGLLTFAVVGTLALALPASQTEWTERTRSYFWGRELFRAGFDSLSVACGAGLLTRHVLNDYSPAGRWTLWTVGHAGALLYVAAAASVLARVRSPEMPERLASMRLALLSFLAAEAVLILFVWAAGRAVCPNVELAEVAWLVGGTFASLGIIERPTDAGTTATLAFASLVAGLGWPVWICVVPALARRVVRMRTVLRLAAGYLAFLVAAALLLWLLESPRGVVRVHPTQEALSLQPHGARFLRCLAQTICASSAGVATEDLTPGAVRDATRGVLAAIVLIGPLGGSAGGGIKWALFACAVAAIAGRGGRPPDAAPDRGSAAGSAGRYCLLAMLASSVLVAIGLLVIESLTATGFQPAPSVSDAWLDAGSALAGAGLSSGLTATVTSPSLTRGLGLAVDLYPVGMLWLMLAMLAGRVLPLWLLLRWSHQRGEARFADTPPL
jgi:hypothetical protein